MYYILRLAETEDDSKNNIDMPDSITTNFIL